MTFAGLPNEKQRADIIAYLNTLSNNPLPLPKAARNTPRRRAAGAEATVGSGAGSVVFPALRRTRDVKSISSRRAPARWRRN